MPVPSMLEYVTFDAYPIPNPAVECYSLLPLWRGPDVRGSDRTVPGVSGVKRYRRRATVSRRVLLLTLYGDRDSDGNPVANVREGIEAIVAEVRAQVADPTNVGDGTRTAVLHFPSGATKTGPVHVISLDLGENGPTSVKATLDLSIPGGVLA